MRIISGNFKGKRFFLPEDNNTRPLRDMVKESIFNLLLHSNKININLKNSVILDLFSGSGSFGIECISRQARKVFFIENYSKALEILKKNIINFDIINHCIVLNEDCFKINTYEKYLNKKFDIIFMDPPYKEKKINNLIDEIQDRKFLNKEGVIIIHRNKKDDVVISKNLNVLDERIYGKSKIIIGN